MLFVSATEEQVLALSAQYLRVDGFFFPSLLIIFIFRNSLQGLGYSREAMLAGVFELIGRVIVASFLVERFGFTAACFASPAAWVAADALLLTLYRAKMGHLVRRERAMARKQTAALPEEPSRVVGRSFFPHAAGANRHARKMAQ